MILPPRLEPGATIGIAALSGPVDPARLDAGIARLRALGYRVVEAPNVRRIEGLFAGSDADRANGYRALLADPEVRAIFFARGGYGATRILPLLSEREIASHPKIHLGASDLTALFALMSLADVPAFYGPMVAVELAEEDGLDWRGVLSGAPVAEHVFDERDVLVPGRARGPASRRMPLAPRLALRNARGPSARKAACSSGRTSAKRRTGSTEC